MSPKDCAYIVERLAIRFMALVTDHERQLAEHRAAFGARTEADAKIIAGLRSEIVAARMAVRERDSLMSERDGLLIQVQDMRAEINRLTGHNADAALHDLLRREYEKALDLCEKEEQTPAECIGSLNARIDRLQDEARSDARFCEDLHRINVELQAEVAALKSQTPKEHPVKVGEWVRRLVPSPACDVGTVAKVVHVDDESEIEYDVKRIDGQHGVWFAKNCEPCDPPIVKREPTIGDTVRLVKIPIMGAVSPELQRVLEWPWIERWGTLNQTALVVEPAYQLEGALSVCLRTNVHVRWPVCCIEVVSEANHDTEAGKAVAEAVIRDSQMTEIKVGDVVEVVSASGGQTWMADVGSTGKVRRFELIDSIECVRLQNLPGKRNALGGYVSLCDVRKVTT